MLRKRLSVFLLLIALFVLPVPTVNAPRSADSSFPIPGLHDKVTIRLDHQGIPNIYASNTHDLFLAQGYMHAVQRWWQMDWQRHQSAGRLSEIVGASSLDSDILVRTLGLARNAASDLKALPQPALDVIQAYTDGVNAWLKDKPSEDLALEYTVLKKAGNTLQVEPWTPLDTMLIQELQALGFTTTGLGSEILKAAVIQKAGPIGGALIVPNYPYGMNPVIVDKKAPSAISATSLDTAQLAPVDGKIAMLSIPDLPSYSSNNWVVSGKLSKTGLPLLANDTHLGAEMPSTWYEVGLHCLPVSTDCPYDVYGFSFAGTPGVVIGHNTQIGWGITNGFIDTSDVYLLTLNPDNPQQYKYDGGYADMQTLTETLKPWKADPQPITIRLSQFGPVFDKLFGVDLGQPVAVRWAAADGNHTLTAVLEMDKAANWDQFQAALADWQLPGVNYVYGDVQGNIGYLLAGRIPKRGQGHDGSVPVPGIDDQYAWQGYVDAKDNPRLFNPPSGFIVTANNPPVAPGDFPVPITSFTDYGYRAARITALIPHTPKHDVDSFARIQYDSYNPAAALVIPVMQQIQFKDSEVGEAVTWLAQWDRQNDAASPQAALFNVFWSRLLRLGLEELPIYDASHSLYVMSTMIGLPAHPLWANKALGIGMDGRAQVLEMAMRQALDEVKEKLGPDRKIWRWDALHVVDFHSKLGALDTEQIFSREIGVAGGLASVNTEDWSIVSGNYVVDKIPGMRMILDFSNFENSRFVNSTGESGDPLSKHYDDAMQLWAKGQYYTHHFSAQAVEAAAEETWTLVPAQG